VDPTVRRHITRILVAEGDEDTRTLYRAALHPLNFDVVDAADGRQALVSALSHPPTLLISETNLLLIDGYSLCGHRRSSKIWLMTSGERRAAIISSFG
jgi:DNA-binding response OmpR family regulator